MTFTLLLLLFSVLGGYRIGRMIESRHQGRLLARQRDFNAQVDSARSEIRKSIDAANRRINRGAR